MKPIRVLVRFLGALGMFFELLISISFLFVLICTFGKWPEREE